MATITGTFLKAGEIVTTSRNNKNYKTRVFYLETSGNPQYPNNPSFTLKDERISLINGIAPGETIEVNFGLNGRFYQKQTGEQAHFNEVVCYGISRIKKEYLNSASAPVATDSAPAVPASAPASSNVESGGSVIPSSDSTPVGPF